MSFPNTASDDVILPPPLRESDPVMFRAGDREFTRSEVLRAASFRSDLDPLRHVIRLGLVAQQYAEDEGFEIDADTLQGAAEAYRIDRDLSTAEDTERWLDANALGIDDFGAWLERVAWRERFADRVDALAAEYDVDGADVDGLLWAEIVFGEHLPAFVKALACRVAAWRERQPGSDACPEASWPEELTAMEAAFDALRGDVAAPANLARELDARRSQLIRFDVQLAAFRSFDGAREAWLCVTGDGAALDSVAAEAGADCSSTERFLDEFPEAIRDRLLSTAPGEVLAPVADGDTYLLCRVAAKRVPETAEEAAVKARLETTLVERALGDLLHAHVTFVSQDAVDGLREGAGA